MTSLTKLAFKLMTTQSVDNDKIRRRREKRRRRQAKREKRARQYEAYVKESSYKTPRNDDDTTQMTYMEEEDDLPSLLSPVKSRRHLCRDEAITIQYRTAEVSFDNQSQPFVGKVQESPAKVHVPDQREWYEIY